MALSATIEPLLWTLQAHKSAIIEIGNGSRIEFYKSARLQAGEPEGSVETMLSDT